MCKGPGLSGSLVMTGENSEKQDRPWKGAAGQEPGPTGSLRIPHLSSAEHTCEAFKQKSSI